MFAGLLHLNSSGAASTKDRDPASDPAAGYVGAIHDADRRYLAACAVFIELFFMSSACSSANAFGFLAL